MTTNPTIGQHELLGYIYRTDDQVLMSARDRQAHKIVYLLVPGVTAAIQAEADKRGISVKRCSMELNDEWYEWEEKQPRTASPVREYAEWKFALNEEQAQAFSEMLGMEL